MEQQTQYLPGLDSRWGEAFINRFEKNVADLGGIYNPISQEFYLLNGKNRQKFNRGFCRVSQIEGSLGLLKKRRLCLCAINLTADAFERVDGRLEPRSELFEMIRGAKGIGCKENTFYAIGVFSPVGWPKEWLAIDHVSSDVRFYLVERDEDSWCLHGSDDSVKPVFDPEGEGEKKQRVRAALESEPDLLVPGGLVEMDDIARRLKVRHELIEQLVKREMASLKVISFKGRSAIQRTFD